MTGGTGAAGRTGSTSATAPSWGSLLWPAVATTIALAILIGLGTWQLERKAWKEGLIAQIETRAYGSPGEIRPTDAWPAWRAEDDEFRRVRLAGRFLADRTVPIHGLAELKRGQAAQGYYLFTPLLRDDGTTVVVNRGFVPTELLDETLKSLRAQTSPSEVVGLVRAPEERGWFVPGNDPGRREWFVRNIRDIAAAERLERVAPFYVDEGSGPEPAGWPRGGQTQIVLRNHHLEYAFTWFGLAATLVGVFAVFARRRLSPDAGEARAGPAARAT